MRFFFSLILAAAMLAASPAKAQIYSCTVNGKTDFQDRPCQTGSASKTVVAPDAGDMLVGCFETDMSTKRVQSVNRVKIRKVPGKGYELTNTNQSGLKGVFLSPATDQEMKTLSKSIFVEVTHGLRLIEQGKPHGLYRAIDKQGKEVFYFYWREDHANPFAKKVAC